MKAYQRQFIEFALEKQVLKFGEFTLKSGRKKPLLLQRRSVQQRPRSGLSRPLLCRRPDGCRHRI